MGVSGPAPHSEQDIDQLLSTLSHPQPTVSQNGDCPPLGSLWTGLDSLHRASNFPNI